MTAITHRFAQAVDYARIAHTGQFRKGTEIPYLYHLVGVASLVMEHGGDEDQAIAGVLHDLLEDCGHHHEQPIRQQFGDVVADIVLACTDSTAEQKAAVHGIDNRRADWLRRKVGYIERLAEKPDHTLLVTACDKLHNAQAIVADMRRPDPGLAVFDRFTGGRDGTLRYYWTLAELLQERSNPVAATLSSVVHQMHELAGKVERERLDCVEPEKR